MKQSAEAQVTPVFCPQRLSATQKPICDPTHDPS